MRTHQPRHAVRSGADAAIALALGAGLGLMFGTMFGYPGVGIAVGLVFGGIFERRPVRVRATMPRNADIRCARRLGG